MTCTRTGVFSFHFVQLRMQRVVGCEAHGSMSPHVFGMKMRHPLLKFMLLRPLFVVVCPRGHT